MSAHHAGTRKWGRIIGSHSESKDSPSKESQVFTAEKKETFSFSLDRHSSFNVVFTFNVCLRSHFSRVPFKKFCLILLNLTLFYNQIYSNLVFSTSE